MNWKSYKKHLIICLFAVLLLLQAGCDPAPKPYTKTGFCLDTIVSVTVYGTDPKKAEENLTKAFSLCKKYEGLFNISDPESDICRLNHAGGKTLSVSDETYDLLKKSVAYAELSGGLLDVTIQPLYELWDFQNEIHDKLPDADAIEEAKQKVDYHNICLLKDHQVQLKNGAQINLGAVAKGYIADRIREELIASGVSSALINLGGNVLTIGNKPDGTPFEIGIAKPFDENGQILTSVSVSDLSVVTSGIYQRCFTINDTIYHHIIDPNTGYPADTDLNAAVIITASSTDADAYSTICMLLGSDKAKTFLKELKNTDAILIDSKNRTLPLD